MEFLVAKLEVGRGVVQLEITADYGANPMIENEAAALEAIRTILRVGGRPLEDLAPLEYEQRKAWDAGMPAAQEGNNHELLTGVWRWQADVPEVTFSVPDGSPNDVLLWTAAENLPGKEAKWMVLIEGENSPVVRVPQPPSRIWPWLAVSTLVVAGLAAAVWRRRVAKGA
jgi:hypothetical protein